MIILNIVLAIAVFVLGYVIRPIVDECKEIDRVEKTWTEYVNESKERHR